MKKNFKREDYLLLFDFEGCLAVGPNAGALREDGLPHSFVEDGFLTYEC